MKRMPKLFPQLPLGTTKEDEMFLENFHKTYVLRSATYVGDELIILAQNKPRTGYCNNITHYEIRKAHKTPIKLFTDDNLLDGFAFFITLGMYSKSKRMLRIKDQIHAFEKRVDEQICQNKKELENLVSVYQENISEIEIQTGKKYSLLETGKGRGFLTADSLFDLKKETYKLGGTAIANYDLKTASALLTTTTTHIGTPLKEI